LKIGRGHICDIRISDISVSRAHAEIEFFDGKFLIKDTKSKFGTLILFDEEFELNEKHPLSLQSGRVLYEFSIDKEPMQEENEDDTES
jgi:predicted component of type VI protein secretion system